MKRLNIDLRPAARRLEKAKKLKIACEKIIRDSENEIKEAMGSAETATSNGLLFTRVDYNAVKSTLTLNDRKIDLVKEVIGIILKDKTVLPFHAEKAKIYGGRAGYSKIEITEKI